MVRRQQPACSIKFQFLDGSGYMCSFPQESDGRKSFECCETFYWKTSSRRIKYDVVENFDSSISKRPKHAQILYHLHFCQLPWIPPYFIVPLERNCIPPGVAGWCFDRASLHHSLLSSAFFPTVQFEVADSGQQGCKRAKDLRDLPHFMLSWAEPFDLQTRRKFWNGF